MRPHKNDANETERHTVHRRTYLSAMILMRFSKVSYGKGLVSNLLMATLLAPKAAGEEWKHRCWISPDTNLVQDTCDMHGTRLVRSNDGRQTANGTTSSSRRPMRRRRRRKRRKSENNVVRRDFTYL